MRKNMIFLLAIGLICFSAFPLSAQEVDQSNQQEAELQITPPRGPTYDPAGRRDPFRDLLAGQEAVEKGKTRGISQLAIDDAILIGIIQHKGNMVALINDSQGFPYTIKTGDNFLDGFVLNVNQTRVVFRKTKERGIPLIKPKDIVKEIKLEER
jgi:Tfp pilus assembly protein PilP